MPRGGVLFICLINSGLGIPFTSSFAILRQVDVILVERNTLFIIQDDALPHRSMSFAGTQNRYSFEDLEVAHANLLGTAE